MEQALVTFVHIVQAWFWEKLVPFYEAHPILTVLLGLIILGSIFRRR